MTVSSIVKPSHQSHDRVSYFIFSTLDIVRQVPSKMWIMWLLFGQSWSQQSLEFCGFNLSGGFLPPLFPRSSPSPPPGMPWLQWCRALQQDDGETVKPFLAILTPMVSFRCWSQPKNNGWSPDLASLLVQVPLNLLKLKANKTEKNNDPPAISIAATASIASQKSGKLKRVFASKAIRGTSMYFHMLWYSKAFPNFHIPFCVHYSLIQNFGLVLISQLNSSSPVPFLACMRT